MNAVRFLRLEVHGVKYEAGVAVACDDSEASFFSIYGLLENASGGGEYVCVGDFLSRESGELIASLLAVDPPCAAARGSPH